jgi:uncharacterized membrane protein
MTLTLIVVLSMAFFATHIVLSHGTIRQGLVDSLGVWPFRGLYSLISFATFGPAAVLWWNNRHLGPVLWELSYWPERILAGLLTLFGFFLLFQLLAAPSPASMLPAKLEARGVLRITRHPMNMGLAAVALAHVLANGTLGDVAFWSSIAAVGLIGPYHMDSRLKKQRGAPFIEFCKTTSVMPFSAILGRRNRLAADELSLPLAILALIAWATVVFFHGQFFGGAIY